SIGKVLPGQEVKLAEDGEILVHGENVSPGYWKTESEMRAPQNGWFHTGDVGEIDDQGNLYFRGRQKQVIVTSAVVNIFPADIELILNRQPEIKDATVIEVESARGPEPLAVLILRDEQANAAAVISRVNGLLAEHQQVRRWFIWRGEDFPRTATQKVRKEVVGAAVRADLANAAMQSAPAEISVQSPANDLTEIITRLGGEAAGTLDRSARLGADLKLDSLARVELLSAIEDRYQIEVDEAAFTDATTLAEVEKLIREGAPEKVAPYPYPKWQRRWPLSWLR